MFQYFDSLCTNRVIKNRELRLRFRKPRFGLAGSLNKQTSRIFTAQCQGARPPAAKRVVYDIRHFKDL